MGIYFLILLIGLSLNTSLYAQVPQNSESKEQEIEVINSDLLTIENKGEETVRILKGNVELRQDTLTMLCDSAIIYAERSFVEAFSNVRAFTPNGSKLSCDRLKYDGKTKVLELFDKIKLTNQSTVLETNRLTYYRLTGIAKYFDGGRLMQPDVTLKSLIGIYETNQKVAHFIKKVSYQNSDIRLNTDTLDYFTQKKTSYFLAPTHIFTRDSAYIYTERGYYQSTAKEVYLYQKPYYRDSNYEVMGDTLFYNDSTRKGWSKCNIFVNAKDSSLKMGGEKANFDRNTKFAQAYEDPYIVSFSDSDTLVLFADTLTLMTTSDSLPKRIMKAHYHARFNTSQVFGISDSMVYFRDDSLLYLSKKPIVWVDSSQISGDTIKVWGGKNRIDSLWVLDNAFAITVEDSIFFNQLKGTTIKAQFKKNKKLKNEIYSMQVFGNSESIYIVKDGKKYLGLNQSSSKNTFIQFTDNKPKRVKFTEKPSAIFIPIHEVWHKPPKLTGFTYQINLKPPIFFK